MLVDRPQPEAKSRPRISEYSPEAERLDMVIDRIAELGQIILAVNGAKPKQIQPMPRPGTAMEKARRRRREAKHKMLVSRVLRHRPVPPG